MRLPSVHSWGTLETPLGWIGLAAGPDGVSQIVLPHPTEALTAAHLARNNRRSARRDQTAVDPWLDVLDAALWGRPQDYSRWPLDMSEATPFQRRVWDTTRQIPWGQTRSYWWVAVRAGDPYAARAVGGAMSANPFPLVVSCHRVLRQDGRLGGFGGGLPLKRRLLEIEGAWPPVAEREEDLVDSLMR